MNEWWVSDNASLWDVGRDEPYYLMGAEVARIEWPETRLRGCEYCGTTMGAYSERCPNCQGSMRPLRQGELGIAIVSIMMAFPGATMAIGAQCFELRYASCGPRDMYCHSGVQGGFRFSNCREIGRVIDAPSAFFGPDAQLVQMLLRFECSVEIFEGDFFHPNFPPPWEQAVEEAR